MHKLISSTVSNSSIAWSQQWLGGGSGLYRHTFNQSISYKKLQQNVVRYGLVENILVQPWSPRYCHGQAIGGI